MLLVAEHFLFALVLLAQLHLTLLLICCLLLGEILALLVLDICRVKPFLAHVVFETLAHLGASSVRL